MRILYATDGSPSGQAVAALLAKIADRKRADVTVLSVATGHHLGHRAVVRHRQDAEEIGRAATEVLVAAGFRTRSLTAEGRPADEILRVIGEQRFELSALAAGHRRVGPLRMGSVGAHVLRHFPSSVLLVREPPAPGDEGQLLVGVDGSPESSRAIDLVLGLADPSRCSVHVVAVAEIHVPTMFPPGEGYALSLPEDADPELTAGAERCIEEAAGRLAVAGFRVKWSGVVLGKASRRIVAEAARLSSDLVAVGSRGLGGMQRTLLGSVSEEVARSARAALVARAGETQPSV